MKKNLSIPIVIISFLSVIILSAFYSRENQDINLLESCLPNLPRVKVASAHGYVLYIVGRGKHARDYLIRINGFDCLVVNRVPGLPNSDRPLSDFIGYETALELNKQRFAHFIQEFGGLDKYQKNIDSIGEGLMPRDVYDALIELGVTIPNSIQVSDSPTAEDLNKIQVRKHHANDEHNH